MKKIVFFTNRMTQGGSERVISYLANGLCHKHEVDIVTMTCAPSDYELDHKVKHIALESEMATNNHSLVINLCRLRLLRKYVIQNSDATFISFVTLPSYIILVLRKYIKGKIIVTVRNDPKVCHSHLFDKCLVRYLYPKADAVVFQTHEAEQFYKNIRIKRSTILPNPLNEKFIKQPFSLGGVARRHEVVNVGRLIEQKNQRLLIDAFGSALPQIPNFQLTIYGDGKLREMLHSYIKECGLDGKVHLAGQTPDLQDKIYDSSLFVLSSDFEGMPNALLEAMALGIPVISTDASGGGPREIIKSGTNGILVPVGDKEALANAMITVLTNRKLSDKLALNASKISNEMSPEATISQWESFISDVSGITR